MKVLRIVSELDFGGVEQVLANSAPKLNNIKNVELTVLVLGKGGKIAEQLMSLGIEVVVWDKNPRIPNILLLFQLKSFLKKIKPDVLHSQGAEANFHGILAAAWAGVPRIIGEEIGLPNHHSYWKYIFKYAYAKANKIIAISEAVKNRIVNLGEVSGEKVEVIYNPIQNLNDFKSSISKIKNSQNDKFIFVTTGRLVPIKNLERLIEAFSQLISHPANIELHIIGDGPNREKLEKLCQIKGISEQVRFSGFQQDVFSFLKNADVFVLPSLSEGSSVSLAEAMAVGLPSIVTKIGGAGEILGDSNSGFLIDPVNTSELKDAMQSMLTLSQEDRKAMGQRAKEEAKRFSVDHYIKSLLKIYGFES